MDRNAPIQELNGVGPKTEKILQKLGVYTVWDILLAFPRDYKRMPEPEHISVAEPEKVYAFHVRLCSLPVTRNTRAMQISTAQFSDGTGKVEAVWFRMPYICNQLNREPEVILYGKLTLKNKKYVMEQPAVWKPDEYRKMQISLQPVYPLTKGISSKQFGKLVRTALDSVKEDGEYIPEEILARHQFMGLREALEKVHFPTDLEELTGARKRLAFDEFFLFLLQIQRFKEHHEQTPNGFPVVRDEFIEVVAEQLPFPLTNAQKKTLEDMEKDIYSPYAMQRLIQGDVGSGKTILAFLIMAKFAHEGYQTAIMAPTEVLARQHYDTFQKWIAMFELDFPVILLTGSLTTKEKREAYARMETEQNAMIIGTHALIQEKALYQKLALVVTDEQHRFGVRQREPLADKSSRLPHVLVMSATPIPRTLAIILYGDLDISVVDELPAERLPVKNCVVGPKMREKSWNFILDEVQKGHQAYIICPLVEANEELELQDVTSYVKKLEQYYGDRISVGLLHGKMRPAEKNKVMEAFVTGEIQVLVSTTVVEVGVNVPNATVMMIEDAQRFGLAQLHQLRGRVGRGNAQSYCILMNSSNGKNAKERLNILAGSNDGFYIASEDLKMRGPGDFFGVRQSGLMEFKIADVFSDADMLSIASEEAKEYVEKCNLNDCEKDMRLETTLKNAYKMTEYNINF